MELEENITTVPLLEEADNLTLNDLLYIVQGLNSDRDRKLSLEKLRDFLQSVFKNITVVGIGNHPDTTTITPSGVTVSGMGDAMATYFEARACYQSGAGTCAGGKVGVAALGVAKLCYDTLIAEGVKAKAALDAGACTTAVEKIIEANTLLSGIGFESGGLAGAHAIHNGLTVLPECHHMQHGEKVNFGTLTQLVLENMPIEDLEDILDWMTDIGLPVTFEELGITDTSREHLIPVAEAACAESDTIHNLPFEVNPEMVYNAMLAADRFGRLALGK